MFKSEFQNKIKPFFKFVIILCPYLFLCTIYSRKLELFHSYQKQFSLKRVNSNNTHEMYSVIRKNMIHSKSEHLTRKRIVVISTFKSGSTLLADLLSASPKSFVLYEPLHHFGIIRLKSTKEKDYKEQMDIITSLLECKFMNYKSKPFYHSFHGIISIQFRD